MGITLDIGNFTASQDEKGQWIFKGKTPKKLANSVKKATYRDKPQYPVIYKIEDKFKKDGHDMVTDIGVQIIKALKK